MANLKVKTFDGTAAFLKAAGAGTDPDPHIGEVSIAGVATSANQSTEITALQLIDDIVHALNAAFGKAAAVGGQLDDTTPTAATEDNVAPVRITPQRAFHTNLRNASGTEIGTASNPVRTDPTGTTTQPVSIAATVQVDVTDEAARDLGKVDVALLDQYTPTDVDSGAGTDNALPIAIRMPASGGGVTAGGDAANGLDVDVTRVQGTVTVSGTVTANAGTGTRDVQGNVAHDGVDSGNPVKMGMKAKAHGSAPTAVADADRVDWLANRHGIPFVLGGHPNIERLTAKYTAAQTDTVLKAVNASQKFVVTAYSIFCDKANTVDVQALLEFDDVTDVRIAEHPGIAAGSGIVEGTGAGILAVGADGQDLIFTCEVPTGGSITVHVSGFIIES